jgi:hypothetical protein
VSGDEDLLQDVLSVLLGFQHRTTEGEQPPVVAVEQGLEGPIVTGADQRNEALIALKPEDG